MRRIIGIALGEGRPPCLLLGLFEGALGQNLPDRAPDQPQPPRKWPLSLIIPPGKWESLGAL